MVPTYEQIYNDEWPNYTTKSYFEKYREKYYPDYKSEDEYQGGDIIDNYVYNKESKNRDFDEKDPYAYRKSDSRSNRKGSSRKENSKSGKSVKDEKMPIKMVID